MNRAILALAAASVSWIPVTALLAQDAKPLTALNTPLPTDERLVRGTLDNGLSYIVMKHANPPGRAVMWIHISTGSMNEKDSQRGIAHYLEHMAFNGSENFPPGSVVDFFQSMGLRFGQDQNAFTSFDQTTYQLSFPDVKPETLEKGMKFFSDVSGKLLLLPEEIDKERQVIFEEKRRGKGGQQRVRDYILERIAPGSLIGSRLPIGTDETLAKVSKPDFTDYYDHWYVPSNMTVLVIADADTKVVVDQITKTFSGGEKKPKPVDQDPKVMPTEGVRAIVASDKELTQASIDMVRLLPREEPTTTLGTYRRDLVRSLGTTAFNRRMGAKLNKGGMPFLRAQASASSMFQVAVETSVGCDGEATKWKDMLKATAEELQRARLHGFTARELDDVRKDMISDAERFVDQESTMASGIMIRRMNGALAQGDTILSAAQEQALLKQLLPTITNDEVASTFAKTFDPSSLVFIAEFPADMEGGVPSESDVVAEGKKALEAKPEADTEGARATELMAAKPTPGKVAQQDEHAASKVVSGWLDNGVRFHYRFMDYKKDSVTVSVSLAAGAIQETAKNRGLAELAGLAWGNPATSTISSTDIRDLMTGKNAVARGRADMDTLSLGVTATPKDLETGMQLAYLMMTDPVIEKPAFDRWKTRQIRGIEERKKSVDGVFIETMAETVYPADEARTQPMTIEQVNKLNPEASQKWLREAIASAPIEVTIVGDIEEKQAMDLLTTYIGSLPKRDRISDKTLDNLRAMKRPSGPRTVEKTVDTETEKARVAVGFYACDWDNVQDRRNLSVASRVVNTRMFKLVREEEQLAYSPRSGVSPAREFPGFGTFAMITETAPQKIGRLIEVTNKLYDDFAKDGPTAEEMETVRKQLANEMDEQMREPGFWSAQTGQMTYRATNLDDVMSAPEYYQKVTPEAVRATFAKYCVPEARMAIASKPAKVAEKSAESAEEGAKKGEKAKN